MSGQGQSDECRTMRGQDESDECRPIRGQDELDEGRPKCGQDESDEHRSETEAASVREAKCPTELDEYRSARVAPLEKAVTDYYVLSLRWTRTGEECITWWGPNNSGYVLDLDKAGRYTEDQISSNRGYYDNRETTLAVPCEIADRLARRIVHVDSLSALASEVLGNKVLIFETTEANTDECDECGRCVEYPGPIKLVVRAEQEGGEREVG